MILRTLGQIAVQHIDYCKKSLEIKASPSLPTAWTKMKKEVLNL